MSMSSSEQPEGEQGLELRESLYLGDFSGNRSVLFPSALDTIAEEDSSRVIQNLQVLDRAHCLTLSDTLL